MMHDKIIDLVARQFQILGDPCRLRILQALQSGAMTVSQIVEQLDGNQPNISKHLQILFDAGLVGRERSGNSIFYSIADPVVFRLCELVCRSTARRAASLHKYALGKSVGIPQRWTRVASSQRAN
ncbi:MAG: ArsR/SmtB family transcription factor [Candidatus Sulfotelmatobacter sp.]